MFRRLLLNLVLCGLAFGLGWLARSPQFAEYVPHLSLDAIPGAPHLSDRLQLGQSAPERAPEEVQVAPSVSPSPSLDPQTALRAYTVDELRRAYHSKTEEIERESIDDVYRIESVDPAAEKALFDALKPGLQGEGWWTGESAVEMGGRRQTVRLLFNFYDSSVITPNQMLDSISRSQDLCYLIEAYFPGATEPGQWVGSSACLPQIRKWGDRRFIVANINVAGIESQFSNLAVEIPVLASGSALLRLLTVGDRKWREADEFTWSKISRDEAHRLERDLRGLSPE
jgi:hypothetical protein